MLQEENLPCSCTYCVLQCFTKQPDPQYAAFIQTEKDTTSLESKASKNPLVFSYSPEKDVHDFAADVYLWQMLHFKKYWEKYPSSGNDILNFENSFWEGCLYHKYTKTFGHRCFSVLKKVIIKAPATGSHQGPQKTKGLRNRWIFEVRHSVVNWDKKCTYLVCT